MATTHLKGKPVTTRGNFPAAGQAGPDFQLTKGDLSTLTPADLTGKRVVFNTFPSVDTPVCATQLKTFSQKLAGDDNTVLVFASHDLPFAFGRFCAAEGIDNAVTASDFRHHSLDDCGVLMSDGPLAGLLARAVWVLDADHRVVHSELVADITQEPDYEAALASL